MTKKTAVGCEIEQLTEQTAALCADQFGQIGWTKPEGYFAGRLQQQQDGQLVMFVATDGAQYVGHVLLSYVPDYPGFADQQLPEIQDLNVLGRYRNQGIGSTLVDRCEQLAATHHERVGIGVGLYADYGAAQRIYVQRGYVPDGRGIHANHVAVVPGEQYRVDDDLVLYFTKQLRVAI